MKRAPAILLCSILLFNCVGWQYAYFILQEKLHETNWNIAAAGEDGLVVIQDGKNVLHTNAHELSIDGHLFDVVRMIHTSHGISYLCKQDNKEEELVANLISKQSSGEEEQGLLIKLIKSKINCDYTLAAKPHIQIEASVSLTKDKDASCYEEYSRKPPFSPPEA